MKYLLDTHTLIWAFGDTEKLSYAVKNILENESRIFVSIISLWEIQIKKNLGKLDVPYTIRELAEQCSCENIQILPLSELEIIDCLGKLPSIHKDPFDRILICQAITDNMTILTRDDKISQYPIQTIW